MSEMVTLELPEHVVHSAREVAARTHRCIEEAIVAWIGQAATLSVEVLSDGDILVLCDMQMAADLQEKLSLLLARQREGQLDESASARLEELMHIYRHGLVRKAQAWKVAVARGLKSSLT